MCYLIVISNIFNYIILIIIIANSIFMAIDDPMRTTDSSLFDTAEIIFVYIYTIEAIIKIIGLGYNK